MSAVFRGGKLLPCPRRARRRARPPGGRAPRAGGRRGRRTRPRRVSRMIAMRSTRVDLGVQVARTDACLEQVVGEILGHLLRQGRDEDALAGLLAVPDLVQEVVDLVAHQGAAPSRGRPHPCGADCSAITFERETERAVGDEHELLAFPRNSSKRSGRLSSATGAGSRSRSGSSCASGRPRPAELRERLVRLVDDNEVVPGSSR